MNAFQIKYANSLEFCLLHIFRDRIKRKMEWKE